MRFRRQAGLVLCVAGFLLVGYGVYEAVAGRIYQAWRGRQLDRVLDKLPPQPQTAVHRVTYQAGSAIGRLEIPRLGISAVVLEGSDTETLRLGIGRLHNSALPGEPGNIVLAGHRDTFFRPLRQVRQGDRISLRTSEGTFPYTVEWTKVVDPDQIDVLMPTPEPSLTLVTCYPFYYIGSAPQRFIVRAIPQGPTASSAVSTAVATVAAPLRPRPKPQEMAVRRSTGATVKSAAVEAMPEHPKEHPVQSAATTPDTPSPGDPVPQEQPAKHGLRGVFHKVVRVVTLGRAKLQ